MKRRIALLIGAVVLAAGCSRGTAPPPPGPAPAGAPKPVSSADAAKPAPGVPSLSEIAAAQVGLGLPTPEDQQPRPLYPDNPQERPVVEKLLGWLRSAEVVEGEISPPSRAPSMGFELRNGDVASVRLAYDCTSTKLDNGGTQTTCGQATGQVLYGPPGGDQELRLRAPDLANWLLAGWRWDVALGMKFCGQEDRGHGEQYDEAARTCLWEAYHAKTSARMITTALTVEGDPITTDIFTRSDGKVNVIVDTRQDHFGEQKVTTYTCSAMDHTPGDKPRFRFTGCTGGDAPEVGT